MMINSTAQVKKGAVTKKRSPIGLSVSNRASGRVFVDIATTHKTNVEMNDKDGKISSNTIGKWIDAGELLTMKGASAQQTHVDQVRHM